MTSPAAVVGLTADAVDIQIEDLSIFLEIAEGLNEPPTVRGSDTVVPRLAGRTARNRMNDILPIKLVGLVTSIVGLTGAAAIASYRDNAATVRALFATNGPRFDLVAILENGDTATISVRPIPGAIWTEHRDHAHVTIPLEGYGDWVIT